MQLAGKQAGLSGLLHLKAEPWSSLLDAAWGTFCHFRRCRSPLLLLLQVEGRGALLNIYNHLRAQHPTTGYNNNNCKGLKQILTAPIS